MKRLLAVLTVTTLLATAQEPGKPAPAQPPAPKPGAPFFEKFDLNKDGKVDWEEYQKVKSGFAALDADRDGAITEGDMAKVMEQRQERMRKAMQRRTWRGMHFGRQGRGWGGGGRGDFRGHRGPMGPGGPGPMGPGRWQGQRGPMGPGGGGWQDQRGPRGPWQDMPRRRGPWGEPQGPPEPGAR